MRLILVADISGYYLAGTSKAAGTFQAVVPARFLDTRNSVAAGADGCVSLSVPVGADGKVSIFNRSSQSTHLLADVSGYFLAG